MQVIKVKIAEINRNPKSAKIHTEEQVRQIANSIEQFGFNDPVGIAGNDNWLVEGDGRLQAMILLGKDEIDAVRLDHLTGDERRAYALAYNQTTLSTGFDIPMLELEIKDLVDFDMSMFGFEMEMPESDAQDDGFDVVLSPEPKTKTGDVYRLGDHRLVCGDATDPTAYESLMVGANADLMLTDPPYNVNYEGKTESALKIANDNMTQIAFFDFLSAAFANACAFLKQGGSWYIFHADSEGENFRRAAREKLGQVRQCIVWVKNTFVIGRQDYQWGHEPCIYGWKEGAGHYFVDDRCQSTVINENRPTRNAEHPTMKPIRLLARLIKNSSRHGEMVIDPFGGSGSTLIACEQLGRKCRTMELDPRYCDVIVERWEKITGRKAELITQGRVWAQTL